MTQYAMVGTPELLHTAALALLIFGGKKLTELMKGLGQGVSQFKKGLNEPVEEEKKSEDKEIEVSSDKKE